MATAFTQMLFGFGVVGVHAPLAYPDGSRLSSLLWGSPPLDVVVVGAVVEVDGLVVVVGTLVVVSPAVGLGGRG